jgi:hypothetical protein
MFAVKKAGNKEMAEPPQLPVRFQGEDHRQKRHTLRSGRLDVYLKPFPFPEGSPGPADKRVPLREAGNVGENLPHPPGRSTDIDLALELFHDSLLEE